MTAPTQPWYVRPRPARTTLTRAVRTTFGLALGLTIAGNVDAWIATQATEPCAYTLCPGPRDIVDLAERNPHFGVNGQIAVYHLLRQRIAGARLTIPPWLADQRWFFERVSRLVVEVNDTSMFIDTDQRKRLRTSAPLRLRWLRSGSRRDARFQRLNVGLRGPEATYVVAQLEPFGELFLVPEALYRPVAVPPPSGPEATQ